MRHGNNCDKMAKRPQGFLEKSAIEYGFTGLSVVYALRQQTVPLVQVFYLDPPTASM